MFRTSVLFVSVFFLNSTSWAQNYPKDFLWGAAFSAHQTEGVDGGGENSDWWQFEHRKPSPIKNGDTADRAVDHWNRYDEDFQAAKSIGLNTIRTSLAWEKIEPSQGVFDNKAIEHYRTVLKSMRAHGLRPMIALHHFVNPIWFEKKGGWTSPESPYLFLEYVRFVAERLGDLCDLWITFNEPIIFVQMAYLKGEIPPLKKSFDEAFEVSYNLARAHLLATAMFHHILIDAKVGLAYAFQVFDPADPQSKWDRKAAEELSEAGNWAWLRALDTGELKYRLHRNWLPDKIYSRKLPAKEFSTPASRMDWLGVNFYNHFLIKSRWGALLPYQWLVPPGTTGDNGWTLYPLGLERITRQVAAHVSYPLLIAEHGLADANDSRRPNYIRQGLAHVDRLRNGSELGGPINILGYYHWSLMDNFEWLHGYGYKFGLFEVQFGNNLARVPRPSAKVYGEEIKKRSTR